MSPSAADVARVRRQLLRWWACNGRHFWWRDHREPYDVAVVEILLKQTRASSVVEKTREFLHRYPSARALEAADLDDLEGALRPFGFQRQRAAHLKELAAVLAEHPDALHATTAQLRQLPGLGLYASTAVSVFAHGRREAVIDVNVVRIFSRLWNISKPRGELRKSGEIAEIASLYGRTTRPREANWALLDLGATVCTEAKPRCHECPLRRSCSYAIRNGYFATG